MKRRILSMIIAMSTILAMLTIASATNETEPNDTIATATQISPNEEVTGNLLNHSDNDYYQFTIPKDGKVSLNFNHEYTAAYGNIELWNIILFESSIGVPLLDFKSNGGTTEINSYLGYISAGTYRICVKGGRYSSYHSDMDYILKVNYTQNQGTLEVEPNNTTANATPIKFNEPITGNIYSKDDVDYYQFTLSKRGSVEIDFAHEYLTSTALSPSYRWRIIVFDSTGATKLTFDSEEKNILINKVIPPLPAGTYQICVNGRFTYGPDYTLKVRYGSSSLLGDVDGNGKVQMGDALEIFKYVANMKNKIKTGGKDSPAWSAALIIPASQKSGKPAIGDALEILKKLAGMKNLIE